MSAASFRWLMSGSTALRRTPFIIRSESLKMEAVRRASANVPRFASRRAGTAATSGAILASALAVTAPTAFSLASVESPIPAPNVPRYAGDAPHAPPPSYEQLNHAADGVPSSPFGSIPIGSVSLATVTGVVTGVFAKRLSSAVAFYVGAVAVGIQLLAYFNIVKIDWPSLEARFRRAVDHNGDGQVSTDDIQGWVNSFFHRIGDTNATRSMLIAGFWCGVRYG